MRAAHTRLLLAFTIVTGACASACNVPDYMLVDDLDSTPGTDADDTAIIDSEASPPDTDIDSATDGDSGDTGGCKTSADCAGFIGKTVCDTATGACVRCTPTEDTCVSGEYCTTANKCATGCKTDKDCAPTSGGDAGPDASDASDSSVVSVLKCDPVSHLCRGCKTDDECPAGTVCGGSGVCNPGCTPSHACVTGKDCCSGSCFDLTSDATHCGACTKDCGTPTHGTAACVASKCAIDKCDSGFGDCDKDFTTGCELALNTVDDCGGCGTKCAPANGTGTCTTGTCAIASCTAGFGDCDGLVSTGCEQTLNTTAHCGACGTKCAPTNGAGSCATGSCAIASCSIGFDDCNKVVSDGCEIDLTSDAAHCGTCSTACPSTRGTAACIGSTCKYSSCASGFGDCDGSKTCSTVTKDDISNCGGCGVTCSVASGTPKCTGTTCGIASCTSGFDDCDGLYSTGCEASLKTVSDCGACGVTCTRAHATPTCSTGSCAIGSCSTGWGNCDSTDSNGCETDTTSTVTACGGCGMTCSLAHATAGCSASACTVASCSAGWANCDSLASTGCERDMTTIANTCAAAPNLVSASGGAAQICGNGTSNELTVPVTTFGEKYYKLRLSRCGSCGVSDPTRATITLVSPAGMAYDLFVYSNTTCGTLFGSSTSGVVGGTETVKFVDTSCPNPKDIVIRVKWRSGDGCGVATLTAKGAYTPYP